jgi:cyclophilin family peptidyl-prolyl cis-trans isomerase
MVGDAPRVSIKTSMGSFEIELYVKHAPRSCKNFMELAKRGYYNGTIVSTFKLYCLHPARNQA